MRSVGHVSVADRDLAGFMGWAVVAALAVYATVSWQAALVTTTVLMADRIVARRHHLMATAAVAALALIPVAWFTGSSLPLSPPVSRVADNLFVHHLAGVAIWLLFLTVWVEQRSTGPSAGSPSRPHRIHSDPSVREDQGNQRESHEV